MPTRSDARAAKQRKALEEAREIGAVGVSGGETPGNSIVIDLAGDGFRFTGIEDGVLFDIDGDGAEECVSWVVPGDDALLVRDTDANG